MEKKEKIALILILILAIIFILPKFHITGDSVNQKHSYTKAICDEKGYCEDYYIECEGKDLAGLTPTGFAIQTKHTKTSNESLCE
ncbi:hypothetical protein J4411_01635 [Candidatus Pacearchaeota archaeon]|nr:hypothetical protein [Candidatus Pacearchaeota archaeon]